MKKLKRLAIILLVGTLTSLAQAMDVAPLYFVDAQGNRIAANLQQEYWNYLVKYKLFGNDFVKTGNRVIIHDESGWTGSNGYFSAEQPDGQGASVGTQLGGPIVVAGKITTGDGYKFTTGPIRGGSFQSGQNCNNCYYAAPICLDNTSVTGGGTAGFQAQPISNCPDQPSPNTAVSIPLLDWRASPTVADIKISANNGEQRIVVPDPVDGSKAPYDMYMDSILTGIGGTDGAKITVSMPAGGRVTRIFVHQIQLGNHTVIQIVYRTPQEDGSVVEVPAEKYVGNLLFYTDHDINIKNTDNSTLLGTYVSTGRIYLQSNINFAGQLIANELVVGNEFDGRSFVFVPIDPPVLDLKPQADTPLEFPENDLLVKVPIALDTPAPADVFIDYCFDLQNSSAGATDFFLDTIDGRVYSHSTDGKKYLFPICGQNMGKVTILKDAKTPADAPDVSVWINVAKDEEVERPNETLRLKITNISGAVLPGNKLDGYFDLIIVDANVEPTSENFEITATEDEVFTFDSSMFKYESAFDKVEQGVVIMSLPEKGFLLSNGDTLTSSDLNKFIPINETTNIDLQFIAAKDEYGVSPAYTSFTFKMKDADNVVSEKPYTVTVKVNPVNDKPIAHDTVYTINENVAAGTAAAGKIRMEDVDDTKFTYAFDTNDPKYTIVDNLFEINSTTGEITVKNAGLDYEGLNADTTMVIKVIVTDAAITTSGSGKLADTSDVTIKVVDVNEAPVVRDTAFTVDENVPAGTEVGTLEASDPDIRNSDFGTLYFSIDENADDNPATNVPFAIDNDGKITVTADDALDFETKPTWVIHVTVTDGFIPQTVEVVINLNDLNEPPHIDDILDKYVVAEHSANGWPVTSPAIKISDPDAGDGQSTLSARIEGKNTSDAMAEQLFEATVATQDGALKIMITVKDSAKLNYETLLASGADTVSYEIRLILTDRDGGTGSFADTAITTICVKDINERPTANDADFTIAENSAAGKFVGKVVASDPDTAHAVYGTLYYSLLDATAGSTPGADTLFNIDNTGRITVANGAVLDYETTLPDHKITLYVAVTDNEYTETAKVTITLTDSTENPEIKCIAGDTNCNGPFKIAENSATGKVIHSFAISDVDAGDAGKLKATLTDNGTTKTGADSLFDVVVNAAQTQVSIIVKDSTKLDFEKINALHEVVITVIDDAGLTDTLIRKIQVLDVNEAPDIVDRNFTPDENIADSALVGEMTVTEPDTKNVEFRHLDFSIIENVPFYMDSNKVRVGDASQLDFETTPEYTFRVVVKNCEKNASTGNYTERCLADTADVKVKLQNVNEDPEIKCIVGDTKCNGPFEIAENSKTGTEIHTFAITDVDANDAGTLTVMLTDSVPSGIAATLFDVKLNDDHTEVTVVVKDSAKLNYEAVDSSYVVILTVKDVGGKTDTLIRTINIKDVNEKPTIADKSISQPENLAKNAIVAELSATDPDTKHVDDYGHLDYSIITPDMPFYMDSNKVKVADSTKIDFETTPEFTFKVKVENCEKNASTGKYTERCLADTATVKITLTNVNEVPEIKCIVGDTKCNGPFEIAENSKTGTEIHTFAITDVDANDAGKLTVALTDSVPGGIAATLFDVKLNDDHTEVTVVVKDSAKLNYEAVDSSYVVILTVKDVGGATDTLIRTINVKDVNEKPTIADKNVKQPENFPKDSVIAEVSATDPDTKHVDDYGHLDYSIITPDMPFYMDSNKVRVGDSTKLDFETTPVFTFKVEVKNCEKNASTGRYTDRCLADTATVVIELKDVNETPKIIIDDDDDGDDDDDSLCVAHCDTTNRGSGPDSVFTVGIDENRPTGTVVLQYVVSDEDRDEVKRLTPTLKDNNSTGVDSLFKIGMKTVADTTWLVVSVKDSSKLDFEHIKQLHEVTIIVTDSTGLADSIVRRIQVRDVNEAPTLEPFEKTIDENLPDSAVVGALVAADPDTAKAFSKLTYTILDEGVPFVLDSNVIKVSDKTKLDYEKTHSFSFNVEVSDGVFKDTALVTIKLKDVNESPKIITDDDDDGDDDTVDDSLCVANCQDTTNRGSGDEHGKNALTVGVDENSPAGTVVLQYYVYDEDIGDLEKLIPSLNQISASVEGSSADELFDIKMVPDGNRMKIVVSVKENVELDYEELRKAETNTDPDPEYTVRIIVSDQGSQEDALKDTIIRIIRVQDVNESPLFTVETCEIAENNQIGDSLGRIEHPSDIDSMSRIVDYYDNQFRLVEGDTALFDLKYGEPIDGRPNIIVVAKVVFDCESEEYRSKCGVDSAFHVVIDYFDKNDTTIKTTHNVPITLIDVNEPPKITTDSVEVKENVEKGTVVDTIRATDPDVYDSVLTYTLVEDESGCFEVSKSGVITVKVDNCPALDYEKNKELPIKVKVTDNGTDGEGDDTLSDTKTIYVKITDVNEAPKLDDKEIHVSEDTKVETPVDTVTASDPDKDPKYNELVYRIIEGDTSVFEIDSITGVITLKDSLDYETKPEYKLVIEVDDGEFTDKATVTVKVDNVIETPKVEITRAETTDSSWTNPDTIYINTSEICIEWAASERKSGKVLLDSAECGIKLDEGENFIVRKFEDPTMDYPGYDTLVVYVSTATPIVTVRKVTDELDDPNIFTVVEQSAKADTAFYVNDPSNELIVTVTDPVSHSKESFTVNVDLDTVSVPTKTFKTLNEITEFGIALNDNPSSGVTHTPVNGEKIAVTYTEKVDGKEVVITYYTDNKGELLENADGVVEMTVTYTEKINGVEVKLSYQADAVTGAVIKTSGGYVKSDEAEPSSSSSGKSSGKSSSSKGGKDDKSKKSENEVVFTVSYEVTDANGNVMTVSYGVDAEGNIVKNENGCVGYEVGYTYTNKYGNSSTQSIFVVLDQVPPQVKILYPTEGEVVYSNFIDVKWTVDIGDGRGPIVQDTLVTQSLNKGGNPIVRFYRDKAGNMASDTVRIIMKNAKDVDIAVEQPVTEISKDKVEEYYAANEPEEGETFAVSIYNPKTDKEIETLVGGDFESKKGSGDEPYPGLPGHLGPTLGVETKVPSVNAVGGLATLDDIVKDGLVMLEDVDANNGAKMPVDEYVEKFCSDEFAEKVGSDLSKANLYRTKMYVKIWIYTTLGSFVDYYAFTQDLDNPDYANDAGLLTLYFEMKPDREGNVRTQDGRLMATGAYIYKTEVEMKMELRCSLPPFDVDKKTGEVKGTQKSTNARGSTRSVTEDMLKSFGYKRPEKK